MQAKQKLSMWKPNAELITFNLIYRDLHLNIENFYGINIFLANCELEP